MRVRAVSPGGRPEDSLTPRLDTDKRVTPRILALLISAFVPFAQHSSIISERAVVTHSSRLIRAKPATGSASGTAWKRGGVVSRATGRVFFTLDGTEYACSAVVVGGVRADVVMTAAHCISDGSGGWARNWTFIPGYSAGKAPHGRYLAKTFFVAKQWADGAAENDDVAFVVVRPAPGNKTKNVANATGSEPIVFGYRSARASVFGYPAKPPFNGSKLDYCSGKVLADPYGAADAGLRCAMTEGDSGGPWLSNFNPATGKGVITGVTSFKYAGAKRVMYSADLGGGAQALYTRAERGLQQIDLAGQGEVGGGEAAGRVGGQGERDRIPGDRDVGMVAGPLGQVPDGVHVPQRVTEVGADDLARYLAVRSCPPGHRGEFGCELSLSEKFHGSGIPFVS